MDALENQRDRIVVRGLRPEDVEPVIALDAKTIGRRGDEYFKLKLQMAMNETGVEVSLAAELDGLFVGFLIARVYYGEFGIAEPTDRRLCVGHGHRGSRRPPPGPPSRRRAQHRAVGRLPSAGNEG